MINWAVVAAFTGPLVAAIIGVATWFAWLARKRDARTAVQIREVVAGLEANQLLMQQRISQVEVAMEGQTKHLDRQDLALTSAMQAIARIEGRLAGPLTITQQT